MSKSFTGRSFGDLGDLLCIIPTARALGKMSLYVTNNPLCKPILAPGRFDAIKPLMDASEYIEEFEPHNGQVITHDMATFRDGGIPYGHSLARLHADWVNVEISEEPWLKIDPNPEFEGCIVINRSTRHRSHLMNWAPILAHYEKDLVFLGLLEEKIQLENETGIKLRHQPTTDLLQCAQIISASRAFLGNQSSLLNIAIAMGKQYLVETSVWSMDCVYRRPDSFYCLDGGVQDFKVKGYRPLNIPSRSLEREVDFTISPPGGYWYLRGKDGIERKSLNHKYVLRETNEAEAAQGLELSKKQDLANQLLAKYPNYGGASFENSWYAQIEKAREVIQKVQEGKNV